MSLREPQSSAQGTIRGSSPGHSGETPQDVPGSGELRAPTASRLLGVPLPSGWPRGSGDLREFRCVPLVPALAVILHSRSDTSE